MAVSLVSPSPQSSFALFRHSGSYMHFVYCFHIHFVTMKRKKLEMIGECLAQAIDLNAIMMHSRCEVIDSDISTNERWIVAMNNKAIGRIIFEAVKRVGSWRMFKWNFRSSNHDIAKWKKNRLPYQYHGISFTFDIDFCMETQKVTQRDSQSPAINHN